MTSHNTAGMPGIDSVMGKEKSVQRMFSSIARSYDLNNTILSFGMHHLWKKQAIHMLGASSGDAVLDLCAGTGDLSILLLDKVGKSGKVVSLDLNREMLEVGRLKKPDAGIYHIQANTQLISFKDESFNKATVAFGMRNLDDISAGFKDIYRVLKPGGKVVCLEFSKPVVPFLKSLYRLYSFLLLPVIGRLVSGDNTHVYKYLPASIERFPSQDALKKIMLESGFSVVDYCNMSGGIVALHIGEKQ